MFWYIVAYNNTENKKGALQMVPTIVIICALGIIYAVYMFRIDVPRQRAAVKAENTQGRFLLDTHVNPDVTYTYENEYYQSRTHDPRIRFRFMVDQDYQRIVILKISSVPGQTEMTTSQEIIPFSELTGCEIFTDDVLTDGIGKMTVDASPDFNYARDKKYIYSYRMIIHANNYIDSGYEQIRGELPLIDHRTSTKNDCFFTSAEFTDSVCEAVRKVMAHEPFEEEE